MVPNGFFSLSQYLKYKRLRFVSNNVVLLSLFVVFFSLSFRKARKCGFFLQNETLFAFIFLLNVGKALVLISV